jgi:hypothetical protein
VNPVHVNGWEVEVWDDVVRGEWQEDDYAYHTHYYLRASNAVGVRFRHGHVFVDDKEGANQLLARVLADPDFTPEGKAGVWVEGQPVYGSEEYQRTGGDRTWHLPLEKEEG